MTETTVTVVVWHNIATDFVGRGLWEGYMPGHPLVPVYRYEVPNELAINHTRVLDEAFQVFNVGDDPAFGTPDKRALEYRFRKNRSLSVGDVVQIASTWWACGSGSGWLQIDAPAWIARYASVHGTTPLDREIRLPEPEATAS